METRTGIIIIGIITVIIGMAAIFAGCNEAFSNDANNISSEQICGEYSTVRSASAMYSPFEKCIIKQNERGNICIDYFSWLKLDA